MGVHQQSTLPACPCPCPPFAPQGAKHLRDIFHRMGFDDKDIVALSGEQLTRKLGSELNCEGFRGAVYLKASTSWRSAVSS